ncbi:MAG: hypothetical protein R3E09_07950 [Novosphingobium sp.]|nr:hypothetical protein [Novosphingobium sp.]
MGSAACSASEHTVDVTASERESTISRFEQDVAEENVIHAIGIYEGGSNHSFRNHPIEIVQIDVQSQGGRGIYLALSSYEPVQWDIAGPGVDAVRGVYVDGYHRHEVTGVPGNIVTNWSNRRGPSAKAEALSSDWGGSAQAQNPGAISCTYTYPGPSGGGCGSAERFMANARSRFHAPVATFTGTYNAQAFRIHRLP